MAMTWRVLFSGPCLVAPERQAAHASLAAAADRAQGRHRGCAGCLGCVERVGWHHYRHDEGGGSGGGEADLAPRALALEQARLAQPDHAHTPALLRPCAAAASIAALAATAATAAAAATATAAATVIPDWLAGGGGGGAAGSHLPPRHSAKERPPLRQLLTREYHPVRDGRPGIAPLPLVLSAVV